MKATRVPERQRRGWGPGALMEERGEHCRKLISFFPGARIAPL